MDRSNVVINHLSSSSPLLMTRKFQKYFEFMVRGDLAQRVWSHRPDREFSGQIPVQDKKLIIKKQFSQTPLH